MKIDLESGSGPTTHHISTLQHLLRAAHSHQIQEQQHAAVQLSKLVEGTVFPSVSFGPLVHALSRLVPSEDKGIACFSVRAVKTLLLDDALRPQAVAAGICDVLVDALGRWKTNNSCSYEILGALQTLMWDESVVVMLVELGVTPLLLHHLQSNDLEITLLSLATLANMLACCDTLLLTNDVVIKEIAECVQVILDATKSRDKTKRCYAVAAIANATSHPILAGRITELGGLVLLEDIERKNKANLSLGGTRVAECAETAVLRLSGHQIDSSVAVRKYTYKWGNKPVIELMIDPQSHGNRLQVCVVIWVLCIIMLFYPLVFSHRTTPVQPHI